MTQEQQPRFGQLLREYRTRDQLSQVRLGEVLGAKRWTISRIERGKITPPQDSNFYESLRNVEGFLNTDIGSLLRAAASELWAIDAPRLLEKAGVNVNRQDLDFGKPNKYL